MKFVFAIVLLCCLGRSHGQLAADTNHISSQVVFSPHFKNNKMATYPLSEDIKVAPLPKWKINKNKLWTGGLVMLSGAAKGFNETLEFNWHGFSDVFPNASARWFWPQESFKNKYKDRDPEKGPKFPLSTSALVFLTDQYHLNNLIQRSALTAALVIKIGEGKKPLKHYVFDALYYTACYQVGFGSVYYYFKSRVPR